MSHFLSVTRCFSSFYSGVAIMYKYCLFWNDTTYLTMFKYMRYVFYSWLSAIVTRKSEKTLRSGRRPAKSLFTWFLYLLTWLRRERDLERDKAWRRERLPLLNAPSTHDKAWPQCCAFACTQSRIKAGLHLYRGSVDLWHLSGLPPPQSDMWHMWQFSWLLGTERSQGREVKGHSPSAWSLIVASRFSSGRDGFALGEE